MTNEKSEEAERIAKSIINQFKGIIYSCESYNYNEGSEFEKLLLNNDDWYRVYGTPIKYKKRKFEQLWIKINKVYADKITPRLLSKKLKSTLKYWYRHEMSKDESDLQNLAQRLCDSIVERVQDQKIFIPIDGIEILLSEPQKIGNCVLYSNLNESEFKVIAKNDLERIHGPQNNQNHWYEDVPCYLVCKSYSSPDRAMVDGRKEASLSLNILRLYFSYDHYQYLSSPEEGKVISPFGLFGSLGIKRENVSILCVPNDMQIELEQTYPHIFQAINTKHNFQITSELYSAFEASMGRSLERINNLLTPEILSEDSERGQVANRIYQAINWYGKATQAVTLTDSLLMFAIAIEALVSENTKKETHAQRVAQLVVSDRDDRALVFGGKVSAQLAEELRQASHLQNKKALIATRVVELFSLRNKIAHGGKVVDGISGVDIVDLSTFAYNAICAFLDMGWDSFREFKEWANFDESQNSYQQITAFLQDLDEIQQQEVLNYLQANYDSVE